VFIALAPRLPERTESPVSPRWNALEAGVHRAGGEAAGWAVGWGRASGPAVLVPQMSILELDLFDSVSFNR
jgi:hypothetical protein